MSEDMKYIKLLHMIDKKLWSVDLAAGFALCNREIWRSDVKKIQKEIDELKAIMEEGLGNQTPNKFTLVESPEGDWQGLYLDMILLTEGHSISQHDLIVHLEDGYESFDYYEVKGKWLAVEGSLPRTLNELWEREDEC